MTGGSIRKDDESGRWFFVIDLPRVEGKKRRQVWRGGFKTKREAQAALDAHKAERAHGLNVDPSRITVGAYLLDHWLPSIPGRVRPTTVDSYERITRTRIVPLLGPIVLQKLERAAVQRWVNELVGQALAPKTIKNAVMVLHKALDDAIEAGLLARNPASRLRALPTVEKPAPKVWSAAQVGTFLAATSGDRLAPMWRLLATTGCRRGEALGLRWEHVDLDAGTVTIIGQRTIAGGRVIEGQTKSRAGARTIALDPATVEALRTWRRQQAAERLMMGAGWQGTDLVFTNPDGGGIWPERVTVEFQRTARQLGLAPIGPHGLRHSAATAMVAAGVSPRVVQQRLGHANVGITLDLYTHVLPSHDRDATNALGAALDATTREASVRFAASGDTFPLVRDVGRQGLEPCTLGLKVPCSSRMS